MNHQLQKEQALIEILKKRLSEKLKIESVDQWQQRDFENLSSQIEFQTKVLLSISTLKRIWKNEYQKLPHKNTLNALVEFIGYQDWYEFACSQSEVQSGKIKIIKVPKPKLPKWLYLTATAAAILILLFLMLKPEPASSIYEASFSSKKTVSQGVPNTVVFDYDISKFDFDSAFIQQSWDKRRRARIEKHEHQSTSVYYFPGYHHAKLIVDDKMIKEHEIYITTDDWITMVQNEKNKLIPVYIKENCVSNGIIQVSQEMLMANNIDLETNDYKVRYQIANEKVWVDSRNMIFETAVKNSMDEGGIACQECAVVLLATNGMHLITVCDKGCVGNINQMFGDNYLKGTKNDFSQFGVDMNQWQNIRLKIEAGIVEVKVGENEPFSTSFANDIGKIIGIVFQFNGCGAIDFVKIKDIENKLIFNDDFDTAS